jgi:hypothetical protein
MKDDDKTLRHFSVLFTSGNVSNLVLRFAWDLKWIDGFVCQASVSSLSSSKRVGLLNFGYQIRFLHLAFKT